MVDPFYNTKAPTVLRAQRARGSYLPVKSVSVHPSNSLVPTGALRVSNLEGGSLAERILTIPQLPVGRICRISTDVAGTSIEFSDD